MGCLIPISGVEQGQLLLRGLLHPDYLREGRLEHGMLDEKLAAGGGEDLAHLLLQLMHKALLHLAINLLPSLLVRLRRAHAHRLLLVRQKGDLPLTRANRRAPALLLLLLLLLLNLPEVNVGDLSCFGVAPHFLQIFNLQLMALV